MSTTYATVDFPPPPASETPCDCCDGTGVTGERYEMITEGPTLLVDVFCPGCGGCGNSDPDHRSCPPRLHAWADDEDLYPGGDENDPGRCRSCDGREWNAVEDVNDEATVTVVRVPCGCTIDRVRLL